MKRRFIIITPVGSFTRASDSMPYTHAVVWKSPRAMGDFERSRQPDAPRWLRTGVSGRWIKDLGYGITWHLSEASARKATSKYRWDSQATLVGVFAAEAA